MLRNVTTLALALTLSVAALAESTTPRASDPDARESAVAMRDALKGKDPAAKAAAIADCGANPHALTAMALVPVINTEADDLRIKAAEALGKMKQLAEAAKVLHGAIPANAKKPAVLTAIFKAVGGVKHESSIPVCRKFGLENCGSPDAAMGPALEACVTALGALRHKDSVEALVAVRARASGARTAPQTTRDAIESAAVESLGTLTSESVGNVEAFQSWWKRHAYEFNDDLTRRPRVIRRGPGNGPQD